MSAFIAYIREKKKKFLGFLFLLMLIISFIFAASGAFSFYYVWDQPPWFLIKNM